MRLTCKIYLENQALFFNLDQFWYFCYIDWRPNSPHKTLIMSLLFETICVRDGVLQNLDYHNERFNRSRKELFGANRHIDLRSFVCIAPASRNGIYKCKLVFDKKIQDIIIEPYTPKLIERLYCVEANNIDYSYKYLDRSILDNLKKDLINPAQEDIMIVRNGEITDSSYANLVFWNGSKWLTPEKPLLAGTKRAKLLSENRIFAQKIQLNDLQKFSKLMLINAMLDFDENRALEIGKNFFNSQFSLQSNNRFGEAN